LPVLLLLIIIVQNRSVDEVHDQIFPRRLPGLVVKIIQPNILCPLIVLHLLPSFPVVQRLEDHRKLSARW
jgi:hypothetical protein